MNKTNLIDEILQISSEREIHTIEERSAISKLIDTYIDYNAEQLLVQRVSNNEERVVVCDEWIHKERREQNEDNFCPICGTDIS